MPQQKSKPDVSNRALEMIMRDVLDGMEDLSLKMGYQADFDHCEVAGLVENDPNPSNKIIFFPQQLRHTA